MMQLPHSFYSSFWVLYSGYLMFLTVLPYFRFKGGLTIVSISTRVISSVGSRVSTLVYLTLSVVPQLCQQLQARLTPGSRPIETIY